MNSNAAFFPALLFLIIVLISAVHHTTPNQKLFGWGKGDPYMWPERGDGTSGADALFRKMLVEERLEMWMKERTEKMGEGSEAE
mmetsp:Transcript_21057/g.43919  ORF Transcript_21057/g.43919 Transcript_21057/m.43919 type:complete len:84 (+) Transcript_21057:128-379(+)